MQIFGKLWRLAAVALCATVVMAGADSSEEGQSGPASGVRKDKPKREPGVEIFDNKHVLQVRLEISKTELRQVQSNDKRSSRDHKDSKKLLRLLSSPVMSTKR